MTSLPFATPFSDINPAVTILLQGPPGSGKTTLAAQFPSPILFNFDGNLRSLKRLPAATLKDLVVVNPTISVKTGKELESTKIWDNFIDQLEKALESPERKTLVIDSLSSLAGRLFDKILGGSDPSKGPQIQDYGSFDRFLNYLGNDVMADPNLDKTIVMLAHEQELKTGRVGLNIPTRQKESFGLFFTDIWRCFTKCPPMGEAKYLVRTRPTMYHDLKCSLDLPAEFEFDKEKANLFKQL